MKTDARNTQYKTESIFEFIKNAPQEKAWTTPQSHEEIALIPHTFNNMAIDQRKSDGYINATAACKSNGKKLSHYLQNQTTREFLQELSATIGMPVSVAGIPATEFSVTQTEQLKALIYIKQGGISSLQGTWVHPHVAIHLAQWISPKFAVLVSQWVFEWMMTGKTPVTQASTASTAASSPVTVTYTAQFSEKEELIACQKKLIQYLEADIARLTTTADIANGVRKSETRFRVSPEEEQQIRTLTAQGMSVADIAKKLNRKIVTIRTVIYRHRKET